MEKIIPILIFFVLSFAVQSQQVLKPEDINHSITLDPQAELSQLESQRSRLRLTLDDGRSFDFNVRENNILSPEVKREMPGILTYDLLLDDKFAGTYTWSEYGVWYYLIIDGEMISVYPNIKSTSHEHTVEYGVKQHEPSFCNYHEVIHEKITRPEIFRKIAEAAKSAPRTSFGEDIREYRLAFVTTGEFYQLNGNAPGLVNATIAATVSGLTALYLNELSVKFVLSRQRIYNNPATDPFDPALGNRTQQAAEVVAMNFGAPLYDIGHALHRSETGDGWESGGVARLNSVCREDGPTGPQPKASGWSGSFNTNGFSWISLIGHEFGHMFGAEHTFNGIGSSCTDAISETTAYEIGSGTTIMSYNGICETDQNIPSSGADDNYFHVNSLMQMRDHIIGIGDCAAKVPSNNNAPIVNTSPCGAEYTIPRFTPFYIEGMAEDPDGHDLTYCWEQFDEDGNGTPTQGFIGTQAAARINTPLFRSFPPTSVPYRYFPAESTVLEGKSSDPFDVLPALARTINMKLTVRDNQLEGGSFTIEDLTINAVTQGPLTVANQAAWTTGEMVDVTWTIGNSDDLCDKVDVLLSVDGGVTFPYVLGDDIDYASGSLPIMVSGLYPNTTTARIKVKCDDFECFYFYDINRNNFRINSNCDAPTTFVCPAEDRVFEAGDPGLNMTNLSIIDGTSTSIIRKTISFANSEEVDVVTFDTDGTSCKKVSDDYVGEYFFFKVDESGTYNFNLDPNESGFGFISVFTDDNFSPTDACPSFVASSAVWSGNQTSVSARSSLTAQLEACTNYRLVFYNYQPTADTRVSSITGPGYVIEENPQPDPNFAAGFIVVDKQTNLIRRISSDPDFTSLPGGEYFVHSVSFKVGGPTPPNVTNIGAYIGQEFNSFFVNGDCLLNSANSFDLTVEGSCSLSEVQLGTTGSCNPVDNSFQQELILIYDVTPETGEIEVNGQTFAISTSPQAIMVSLPSTGGDLTSEVFFTVEPNCRIPFTVSAPDNCCPFELDLNEEITICSGESVDLNAGDGGQGGTYEWFDPLDNLLGETGSILSVNSGGDYKVIVTNNTGCAKSDTVEIAVLNVPTLQASDDITICDGENTTLSCTTTGDSIRWSLNGEILSEGISSTLVINTGGTYVVEAFFTRECVTMEEVVVTANESPQPDLGGDVFLCEGEFVDLDGTSNGNEYEWFKDNVLQAENGSMFTVDETATIRVEVTNMGGCTGTDEVDVLVEGIPTLTVSDDVTICDGEETILQANTMASLIKWYVDDVLVKSGPETNYNINTGGVVRVEAGNSENCSVEEIITVTANESPDPNLGFDQNLCEGENVRLSGAVDGETYTWYKDDVDLMEVDSFIFVNETATYKLEVTNVGGCTGTDEINVSFFALPSIDVGEDIVFCEGEDAVVDASTSSNVYFWFKDGQPYSEIDLMFNTDEPGEYVLEAQNEASCSIFDTLTISSNPSPNVELGDDRLACIGDEVTFSGPSGDFNYEWFANGNPVSQDEEYSTSTSALIVLIVTDMNNCSSEDNVNITFEPGPTLSINESSVDLCEGDNFLASVATNASGIQWYKDGEIIDGATSTELDIIEEGSYVAQALGAGGCVVEEEIVVTINPIPNVDLPDESAACNGEMLTLTSNVVGNSYSWTFNGMVVSTMESVQADQEGIYMLEVTNEFDCVNSDQTNVSFVDLPTIDGLEPSASFCEGETITLAANSNGSSFQWYLDGQVLPGETNSNINVSESGMYTFESIGLGDCIASADVNVVEVQTPSIDLGGDVTLCPGEMISLDAGAATGGVYEWNNGESTRIIQLTNDNVTSKDESTLMVTVTNAFDCSASESILVTLLPVIEASITAGNNGVCEGDSLVLSAAGGEEFTWNGPAGTFEEISDNSILVYPDMASEYAVLVTDQCPNNEDRDTISLDVFVPMDVTAGNDTCALQGRTIELNASGGVSYRWEEHPSFEGSINAPNPEVSPTEETTYMVTITDENGCISVDEVVICIIDDPLSIFKAPTAITPNDDGMNDQLIFPGLEAFEENKLIIYNRWGNVVYEKENYQQDLFLFDGTRNGELLPADTYYYILIFDEFKIKETLTILRSN